MSKIKKTEPKLSINKDAISGLKKLTEEQVEAISDVALSDIASNPLYSGKYDKVCNALSQYSPKELRAITNNGYGREYLYSEIGNAVGMSVYNNPGDQEKVLNILKRIGRSIYKH